ncbi:MAG: hypothetical protein ABSA53_18150 [Streptosporangiaceae bacterium]
MRSASVASSRWPRLRWSWLILLVQEPDDVGDGAHLAVAAADDVGDQAGPAGLVPGAEGGAVVAVEVLAEQQVVPPGGVAWVLATLGDPGHRR